MDAAVDLDAMLMHAYARGHLAALETLYAHHRGMLYRFLLRRVRDPPRTNELFQETWSRVISARTRYQPQVKASPAAAASGRNASSVMAVRAELPTSPPPQSMLVESRPLKAMIASGKPKETPQLLRPPEPRKKPPPKIMSSLVPPRKGGTNPQITVESVSTARRRYTIAQQHAPARPARAAPSAAQAVRAAPAAMQTDDSQVRDVGPAQVAELEAIRQLFGRHHDEKAQRKLEVFHRLHPQCPLPADLKARLRNR